MTTRLLVVLLLVALSPAAHADEAPAEHPSLEPQAPPPPVVGFKKGFFLATPDDAFRLILGGRVQFRGTYLNLPGEPRTSEGNFELPRVRFKMSGHAFSKHLKFKMQIDFAKGQVSLKDAYVDVAAHPWFVVRLGQFKVPTSRQFLTSSTKQHFVDRSITHKSFDHGRDIGVMILSDWKKAPIEYAIGLFDGTGDAGRFSGTVLVDPTTGEGTILGAKSSNVPRVPHPMLATRVGWHSEGFDGYSESDLANSPFGLGVGGGVVLDFDAEGGQNSAVGLEGDFALKARGFSTTAGFYARTAQDGAGFSDQGLETVGFHASVAYAIASRVEPTFRYARVTPADASGDRQEVLGGVTVFFFKHHVKWATDAGVLSAWSDGVEAATFRLRSQFQLDF